jgi:hypothetical protein
MPQSVILTGANIKIYANNKTYNSVASVSFVVDYGEAAIYGIDSPWPQELAPTRVSVTGSIRGFRLKLSGGLQGSNLRPLFTDIAASPLISLRITDRYSGEDILFLEKAKITRESHEISTKSTYKLNFDFIGMIPLFALDRA